MIRIGKQQNSLSIVKDLFGGNYFFFQRSVKIALREEAHGGYQRGTPGFCRYIFSGAKIDNGRLYYKYRGQILKAIKELEAISDNVSVLRQKEDVSIKGNQNIRCGAQIAEAEYNRQREMLGKNN